jgi:predicted dehydrogenase
MSEKLKLALIGTGSVVREIYRHLYFASDFAAEIEIVGVAEVYAPARDEFCRHGNIPAHRQFSDYREMLAAIPEIDAVQVNTPDHLHCAPTLAALERGCDVLIPKPTADTIADAHRMITAAKKCNRLLGIDFHKREDPRIKECAARYRSGRYGPFQCAVWYMLDKLLVADPNHQPRFFASPDFAAKNSPVSFLTVHMADAFMHVVHDLPVRVRARGYAQKLPSLRPVAVDGYDLVDTEIVFRGGGVAHIITGWHLPNTAHSTTVQSSRIICRDGVVDLGLDTPGYHELTPEGILEANPLFRNFEADGTVSGYGMSSPGRLLRAFRRHRQGELPDEAREAMMSNLALGFHTTLVLQGAEESLRRGRRHGNGVVEGIDIDLADLLRRELADEAAPYLAEIGVSTGSDACAG